MKERASFNEKAEFQNTHPIVVADIRLFSVLRLECAAGRMIVVDIVNSVGLVVVISQNSCTQNQLVEHFLVFLGLVQAVAQNVVNCLHSHDFMSDFSADQNVSFMLTNRSHISGPQLHFLRHFDLKLRKLKKNYYAIYGCARINFWTILFNTKSKLQNILTEILTCKTSFRKNHFAIEFFQVQFVWKNFIFRDQNFHFL